MTNATMKSIQKGPEEEDVGPTLKIESPCSLGIGLLGL